MTTTIRPLHDRILVRRDEAATRTEGGIILPETAAGKDRPQKGTVLAVGPGKRHMTVAGPWTEAPSVQAGDEVLFTKFAGEGIKLHGEEYFLVRDEEIIAVITRAGEDDQAEDDAEADSAAEEMLAAVG